MSVLNISTRYASALMGLSDKENNLQQVFTDMQLVFNTLKSSKELRSVMANPIIKEDKKREILEQLFTPSISVTSINFIRFVIEKNRQNYLFQIAARYLELADIRSGIVNAQLISKEKFSDEQLDNLKKKLEKQIEKKIRFTFKIDENMLGGFLLKINDTIIDATVEHQLEKLRIKLKTEETLLN